MADYQGLLADLKAKRAALDRERERLDTAITAIEPLVPGAALRDGITARAFAGLNLPQALTTYSGLVHGAETTDQVANALAAGGVKATAKTFRNQVYNILCRLSKADGPWQRELAVEHKPQREFLRTLLNVSREMTDDELTTKLGLSSHRELRGLIIGIVRRVAFRNLPNPIQKEMSRSDGGKKRTYRYTVTPAFRRAIGDAYKFDGGLLETA